MRLTPASTRPHATPRPLHWLLVLPFAQFLACSEPPTAYAPVEDAFSNASPKTVSVTAAEPSDGLQGQTLVVRVVGLNFAPGATAAWERGGVSDPGVVVTRTDFVNASELRATISIQNDASTELYDIAVVNPDRKKGVGSELFKVKNPASAGLLAETVPLPPGGGKATVAFATEDGWMLVVEEPTASLKTLYLWDGAASALTLVVPEVSGWISLDASRNVYVQSDVYLHTAGAWSAAPLPLPVGWSAAVAKYASDAGWIVGTADSPEGVRRLLRWRPVGNGAWEPEVIPDWPADSGWEIESYSVTTVNNNGQAVGSRIQRKLIKGKNHTRVAQAWTWYGPGTDIVTLPQAAWHAPGSAAVVINDQGVIAGLTYGGDPMSLLRWIPSADGYADPQDLGPSGSIRAIDECGRIPVRTYTGSYQGYSTYNATILDPDAGTRLELAPLSGQLTSVALDITTSGIVVGYSTHPVTGAKVPSLWRVPPCPGM